MIVAYTDGACRINNPGVCSCAFAVLSNTGISMSHSKYLGPELHTNNFAEYSGLIECLKFLDEQGFKGVLIRCDSQLIVKQVNGEWNVKHEELKPLHALATALLIRGGHTLEWIKGHNGDPGNEMVDRLCNEILDKEIGPKK